MAERRIFQAIDVTCSSTRQEELLLSANELRAVAVVLWRILRLYWCFGSSKGLKCEWAIVQIHWICLIELPIQVNCREGRPLAVRKETVLIKRDQDLIPCPHRSESALGSCAFVLC